MLIQILYSAFIILLAFLALKKVHDEKGCDETNAHSIQKHHEKLEKKWEKREIAVKRRKTAEKQVEEIEKNEREERKDEQTIH